MTTTLAELTPDRLAVGKPSARWVAVAASLGLFILWAAYAYSQQLRHGLIVTGMRTIGQGGASWGIYVGFYVYFVGVSFAGVTVAALVRLFALEDLRPLTRMAELLTITALLMGALAIGADLERPVQSLLYLSSYARPFSPFFGTFTLVVAGYLFASLVYFYLAGRADAAACAQRYPRFAWAYRIWASGYRGTRAEHMRHRRSSFWLSLFILPLLVIAHSTLGFVFGIQGGRPGWFSALQAPGFVILAGASGIGMLIVIAGGCRRWMGLEDVISPRVFRMLSNFLWVLLLIYLYFMIVEEMTAGYASSAADERVAHAVIHGAYAHLFWTTIVCFAGPMLLLFVQFVRGTSRIGWAVMSGILVNVGAILKRFLIVVPSQTHGMLLPYRTGHYVPSWVELSVILGLFSIAALMYIVFIKVFPIVPIVDMHADSGGVAPMPKRIVITRRGVCFWITLLSGLALTLIGLLFSLRMGTLPYLDPVVPYSPVIFILGVIVTSCSPAVYETVPPPYVDTHEPTP